MCASPLDDLDFSQFDVHEVHHWPIVRAFADRLGLVKLINDLVPCQMDVEPGVIVLGMIIDTLSGRSPLYHLERFFQGQDMELLLGRQIEPDYFNDDNVGRVLDLLYERGTNFIFSQISVAARNAFQIPIDHIHHDTTSIVLYGDYTGFDEESGGPQIKHGYSKDKRPDLKQVMKTLLCTNQGIPLLGRTTDGNASDKTLNNTLLTEISKEMAAYGLGSNAFLYVADSAMVTEKNLKAVAADNLRFVTRLPANYNEHARVISEAVAADKWEEVGVIAITKPTKSRPQAKYKTYESHVTLHDETYRAVVVHSSAHDKRRQKKLGRQLEKSRKEAESAVKALSKQTFYCEKDAQAALDAAVASSFPLHSLIGDVVAVPKYGRGRPKAGQEKEPIGYHYRIDADFYEREDIVEQREKENGCFVLLTNTDKEGDDSYSSKEVLIAYKDQNAVERNFSFLKNDAIVNALFLKTPRRIEALGLILLLALLIWRLLEREMREYVKREDKTLEGWDKKPTKRPTGYMLMIKFKGMLIIRAGGKRKIAKPITAELEGFLKALGLDRTVFSSVPDD